MIFLPYLNKNVSYEVQINGCVYVPKDTHPPPIHTHTKMKEN